MSVSACAPRVAEVESAPRWAQVVEVDYAESPTATADRPRYTAGDTVRIDIENRTADVVRVAFGAGQVERREGGRWERWADVCPVLAGDARPACLDPVPRVVREVFWLEGYRLRMPPSAPAGTYRYAVTVTRSQRTFGGPPTAPARRERLATPSFEVAAPAGALVVPRFTPDPERFYPEAFIAGRIVREGPCLRLDAGPPFTYVVVWPPGTTASADGDGARLADGRVARAGDVVTGGGGFGPATSEPVRAGGPFEVGVPAACPGPVVTLVPVEDIGPGAGPTAYGGLYFPQLTVAGPSASARLEGRLLQRGPCLYVEAAGWDETYLVVWAAGFMPEGRAEGGGPLRVRDVRSGQAAMVGEPVVLGGLEAGRDAEGLRSPLPAACPGPVWRAGEIGG